MLPYKSQQKINVQELFAIHPHRLRNRIRHPLQLSLANYLQQKN